MRRFRKMRWFAHPLIEQSSAGGGDASAAIAAAVGSRRQGIVAGADRASGTHRTGGTIGSDDAGGVRGGKPLRFRAIFISDTHLGTPGCQARALLDFLRHTESDYLYLVGDIIDGWQLRRRWYWHQSHNDIVQKVLRKARKGTEVIYVPGNHDDGARHYVGLAFGDIVIRAEAIHETAGGLRLLVTHGDSFDAVVRCARWIAHVGDALYTFTLKANRHLNAVRAHLGLPYWSLSQFLKHKVKNAVNYITAYEEAIAREARERGLDGVVCGHIHKAEIRTIEGMLYCNDGDWVESLTALVETVDGKLSIVHWHEVSTDDGNSDHPQEELEHANPDRDRCVVSAG